MAGEVRRGRYEPTDRSETDLRPGSCPSWPATTIRRKPPSGSNRSTTCAATGGASGPNSCWRSSASGRFATACRSPPAPPRPTSTPSPPTSSREYPGDREIERKIKSIIRWNAMAMVVRANKREPGHRRAHLHLRLGRHALRGGLQPLLPRQDRARQPPDQVFFQGHASPGIYARAFLQGRLTEQQLNNFRRELAAGRRAVVLSAPLAHARLLGVPHGLDGPGADHGHLPGPLQPLPGRPRHQARRRRRRGSGPSWATASATSRRRSAPSRWPPARSSTT